MNERLDYTIHTLQLNSRLFRAALHGLSYEEVHRRPGPASSSMLWIAGHTTYSRCGIGRMLGLNSDFPWQELFDRGSRLLRPEEYPTVDQILEVWGTITNQIPDRIVSAPARLLEAPAPRDFPFSDKSVAGGIAFLAYHETYHIGQLALLRKWLGYEGLVG